MSTVQIVKGHTHADLGVTPNTYVSSVVGDFIRSTLTEYSVIFNKKTFRKVYTVLGKYATFDMSTNILHIPIGFVPILKTTLQNRGINVKEFDMADYPVRRISMSTLPE